MRLRLFAVTAAVAAAGACSNAGSDRILGVSATASVQGTVYFDRNGNGLPDGADTSVTGARVTLRSRATGDSVASDVTDATGLYTIDDVPVGVYTVTLNPSILGDTAVVAKIDSTQITLDADTTPVDVNIGISYPNISIDSARALVPGRKVFITGIVLNSPASFRDTLMSIQDTSGAIRVTRLRTPGMGPGDSVRLRGSTARRLGQPTLDDVTGFFLGNTFLPTAVLLTTAQAASAQAGTLDARLVNLANVPITDTTRVGQGPDFLVTFNDGSGALEVLLDGAWFTAPDPVPPTFQFVPGNRFDIVGILTPTASAGVWRLKPRSNLDLIRR